MATLKSLVDETSNIKNELIECHTNLSNVLTLKGQEISSEDKLSSLISKISNIRVITDIPTGGEDFVLYSKASQFTSTSSSLKEAGRCTYKGVSGSVRVSVELCCTHPTVYGKYYVQVKRGAELVFEKIFNSVLGSAEYRQCSVDVPVQNGDIIICSQAHANGSTVLSQKLKISYSYLEL